jgi:hypothetical protein
MPTGVIYDSDSSGTTTDFTVPQPAGPKRVSYPFKNDTRAVVMRQRFSQLAANFTKLPFYSNWTPGVIGGVNSVVDVTTAGPSVYGQGTWLVDETDLEDAGGGDYVEWDRVYASIPPPRQEPVTATKNFQSTGYQFNTSNVLVTMQVYSYSDSVRGYAYYNYFLAQDIVSYALPGKPFVQIYSLGSLQWIKPFNGFPTATVFTYTLPIDNNAECVIGGEIGQYMGNIWYRKVIYG